CKTLIGDGSVPRSLRSAGETSAGSRRLGAGCLPCRHDARRSSATSRPRDVVQTSWCAEDGVMFVDLHVHTCFSFDSLSSPDEVLRSAKRAGLQGVAVTDHDTIKGALETRARNHDSDFVVIVGCEKATDAGDMIGLFLREEIRSYRALDVIDEIHEQ